MIYIVCSEGERFVSQEEQRTMSRKLLRDSLMKEFDIRPGSDEWILNSWGKPFLKDQRDVYFSISHCPGGVSVSVSSCRTGIDIERVRPFSLPAGRRMFSKEELEEILNSDFPEKNFFRLWTLKESYSKAIGTGLSYPLSELHFANITGKDIRCERTGCLFCLFENNLNFVTAVCYLCRDDRKRETVIYRQLP